MRAMLIFSWTMFKRFLRDPVYLFFMFAFPLIFLFIFGTIFGSSDSVNLNVAVINHSNSQFAKTFSDYFDSDDNTTFTVNQDISEIEDARLRMSRGEISSIIELPADFGQPASDCQNTAENICLPSGQLNVYYDEGSPQVGQTVAMILSGILEEINVKFSGQPTLFRVNQKSIGAVGLNQFDYIFSGLLSYVLMTMGIYALSQQLPSEKKTGALRRIKSTPFSSGQLIFSLALVYLALTLISAALMVGVGLSVFGFQMRGSWLVLAVFSVISTLTMIGFGAIVAGAAKNGNQATMGSQLMAFPMMFLSGVFFSRLLMPDWLQSITNWIPLTPVGDGIRYITTENASLLTVLPELGMIAAWGVVAYLIAFKVFRWE
jgi:ABC-2 type transport system permease protein